MIDEMDLLSGLKAAETVRPRAFEEARAVLRTAMTIEEVETKTAPRRRARWGTRRTAGVSLAALGAAAAAVALVVTSTSAPSHNAAASGRNAAASGQPSAPAAPAAANPVLAKLAANITVQQVKLPGNATLEIRNHSAGSATPGDNGIDLYTDNGTYYWGDSKSTLQQSIAQGQDVGQGAFKRAIAAALIAVNGNVATARAKMAIANYIPGTNPDSKQTAIDKLQAIDKARGIKYTPPKKGIKYTPLKPLTPQQKQEQTDSFIYMNAVYALTAAPDNPQVRAGVLDILATISDITVTHTTTAGQPTLTLVDNTPDLFGGGNQSMVINASTGFPVAGSSTTSGVPSVTTYYHVSRVTLANVEAGKF